MAPLCGFLEEVVERREPVDLDVLDQAKAVFLEGLNDRVFVGSLKRDHQFVRRVHVLDRSNPLDTVLLANSRRGGDKLPLDFTHTFVESWALVGRVRSDHEILWHSKSPFFFGSYPSPTDFKGPSSPP